MTHPAYAIAEDLQSFLSSACARLCLAGSLRRGKEAPKDIELVARPNTGVFEVKDMFGYVIERHAVNHLDDRLDALLAAGAWKLDTVVKRNGPNYKRLKHVPSGLACDLFIVTDPRKWGIIYTIRTGSGQFSEDMVTLARRLGWFVQHGLLHAHAPILDEERKVMECEAGGQCIRIHPTLEEADFFDALAVPYIEPRDRTTLIEALARREVAA